MNQQTDPEIPEAPQQANAVSLFGQDAGAANDFPVLKAFQQYIDAEQAKARKRMVGLSAFFIVLIVVLVAVFMLIMTAFITRNQALSDRLLDLALREKSQPQPVVTVQQPPPQPIVQPPSQESVLKPVLDQIEKLASALTRTQQQPAPAPVVVTTAPAPAIMATPAADTAETARLKEELRRQQEELKTERARYREELRQAEIEKHRRRLYPEYYARQDAKKAAEDAAKRVSAPSSVHAAVPVEQPVPVVARPQSQKPASPVSQDVKPVVRKDDSPSARPAASVGDTSKNDRPINYFDNAEDDEEELKDLLKKSRSAAQKKKGPVSQTASAVPEKSAPPLPAVSAPQKARQTAPMKKDDSQPAQTSAAKPAPAAVKSSSRQPARKTPAPAETPQIKTETITVGSDTNAVQWLLPGISSGK